MTLILPTFDSDVIVVSVTLSSAVYRSTCSTLSLMVTSICDAELNLSCSKFSPCISVPSAAVTNALKPSPSVVAVVITAESAPSLSTSRESKPAPPSAVALIAWSETNLAISAPEPVPEIIPPSPRSTCTPLIPSESLISTTSMPLPASISFQALSKVITSR